MSAPDVRRDNHADRATPWRLFALVVAVYALTGSYTYPEHIDTVTPSVQAWSLARNGSFDLSGLPLPDNLWLARGEHGLVADRMPGPVLASLPAYALQEGAAPVGSVDEIGDIPIWPPNATAVLLAAAAAAMMVACLRHLVEGTLAWRAALVFAFGTATWSVSANAMWTHTVTQPAIAYAAWALARGRTGPAGLGFAAGTVGRLHVAAIAAGVGIWRFLHDRRWTPMLALGMLTALGLVAAGAYYLVSFGTPVPDMVEGRSANLGRGGGLGPLWVPVTFVMLWVAPRQGLLVWTPVLIPLLAGIVPAWRRAPVWVQGLALGGLLHLVIQAAQQPDWTGGNLHFGSRLSLETLTACVPLLTLAYQSIADRGQTLLLRLVHIGAMASIALHAVGATVMGHGVGVVQFPWW